MLVLNLLWLCIAVGWMKDGMIVRLFSIHLRDPSDPAITFSISRPWGDKVDDDWNNFDIARVPPVHLDPAIWSQIKTVGYYNGFQGTFLDPEVWDAALVCKRNGIEPI